MLIRCFLFILCGWLSLSVAFAGQFTTEIKKTEIALQNNQYLLNADFVYHLSPKAQEALQNGVPLSWIVKIKLQQVRPVIWNKVQKKWTLHYQLQYHALLNMYRIKNEELHEVTNFSTLPAALNALATLRDFPLSLKNDLNADKQYELVMRIFFDKESLPLPLRSQLIIHPQWDLSSDWTIWSLEK